MTMALVAIEGDTERQGTAVWRLPLISDRWWPAVRGFLWAFLALAIVLEVLGLGINYTRSLARPFAHIGLSGWNAQDGKVTIREPHTAEAVAAGLREGMTIVAIDDIPVGNRAADMQAVDRLIVGPEGSQLVLRTRDSSGALADHRLTRSSANADALHSGSGITSRQAVALSLATQAIPDFFLILVSAILLRSRRRDSVGLLLAFGFTGLVLTGPATYALYSSDWQLLAGRVITTLTMFAIAAALLAFPDGKIVGRARRVLLVIAASAALLSGVFGAFGSESLAFVMLTATVVLPSVALILRARTAEMGAVRQQIRYALFGFAAAAILMILAFTSFSIAPPVKIGNTALTTWMFLAGISFGALSMIALSGGLLLSLLRYRLYDVDTVISRSAAYGLMTVLFIAAFAGLENLLEQAAQTYFSGNAGKAAGAISAALAAGLIWPMHNRIHAWTERRFRKGLVAMRRDLPNAIDDLRETATFDELAAEVEADLALGVSADWVRLRPAYLMNANDIDVRGELERTIAGPDGRALALLEVGPRPDGSSHGRDEREAIDALVEPLARALLVIERREAKEKALDARIGLIEKALASLTRTPRKKPA